MASRTTEASAVTLGERLRTNVKAASGPGALMAAADEALYRAKRAGGDRVAVHQDGGFESSSSWARRYA